MPVIDHLRLAVVAGAATLALSGAAHAANLLQNGDFEANGGSLDGWTVSLAQGAQLGALTAADYHPCCQTIGGEPAYSHNHFAEFDDGNVTGLAILSQAFNSVAGAHYTLSFDAGAFGDGHNDLLVGSDGLLQTLTLTANDNADTTFGHYAFGLVGIGGGQLIAFAVNAKERDNTDALLDNVSLTLDRPNGGVPEPAAWALMLAGFGAAGASLRSRRTAVA